MRDLLDRIGIDPYDVRFSRLMSHTRKTARPRQSRFWFRSPCWAVRRIDFMVHRWLPAMMLERWPGLAHSLGETSPRWGHVPICRVPVEFDLTDCQACP